MPAMISAKGFGNNGDDMQVIALFHRIDELFYANERRADNMKLQKAGNAYVTPAAEGSGMLSAEAVGSIGVFEYFASLALLTSGNDKDAIERTWDARQKELLHYVATSADTSALTAWNASVDALNGKLKQKFGVEKAPMLTRAEVEQKGTGPEQKELDDAFNRLLRRAAQLAEAKDRFIVFAEEYDLEGDDIDALVETFVVDLASIKGADELDRFGKQLNAIILANADVKSKIESMMETAEDAGEDDKVDRLSEVLDPIR